MLLGFALLIPDCTAEQRRVKITSGVWSIDVKKTFEMNKKR